MTKSNERNGAVAPPTEAWGVGLSQADLMEKDTVLVLNDADSITGTASKRESHVFSQAQPRGILHRAFSVFLFEEETGRLLLQQRAGTKITFPNVSQKQ
jgi:isopentenyl-diphosphate delta-isomerase